MLDMTTAKLIHKAIVDFFAPHDTSVTLEDVRRMNPISVSSQSGGYTILALQYGDLTILVWMQVSTTGQQIVRRVKTVSW